MTDSTIQTAQPLQLDAVWIHDPDDPEGTLLHYPYSSFDDRNSGIEIPSDAKHYAGRVYPAYDFSLHEQLSMKVQVQIIRDDPYSTGKGTYQDLEAFVRSRRPVTVRDGAGRVVTGPLQGLSESGTHYGFVASFVVNQIDLGLVLA
jgi:hypothetical protein